MSRKKISFSDWYLAVVLASVLALVAGKLAGSVTMEWSVILWPVALPLGIIAAFYLGAFLYALAMFFFDKAKFNYLAAKGREHKNGTDEK